MPTVKDYWRLADEVHSPMAWGNAPTGWAQQAGIDSRSFFPWRSGHSGFQGACYTQTNGAGTDVVMAIAGSQGTATNDLVADVRLLVSMMPRQASSARKFFDLHMAPNYNKGDIVIVGHSLGGALAQVLGFWNNVRFVTFNAPGMGSTVAGSMANLFKPQQLGRTFKAAANKALGSVIGTNRRGINLILWRDVVGNFGPHIGDTYRLDPTTSHIPGAAHGLDDIKAALKAHQVGGQSLWGQNPFAVL
jgi:hypothetical protein